MDPNTTQQLIEQNAQQTGQRQAALPSFLQPVDYGHDPQYLRAQAQHDAKIQELYQYDKTLATQYSNPQSDIYMANPYQRELATAAQYKANAGELADLNNQMSNRKSELDQQNQKALQWYQIQQPLIQQQQKSQALQTFLNAIMGGTGTGAGGVGAGTLASTGSTIDPQRVQQLLAATIAANPDLASEATQLASLVSPKTDTFGYSADESLAGVAGQQRTPLNQAVYQDYLVKKQKADNQLVVNKGLFGTGLFGSQQLVNKTTGQTMPVSPNGPNGNVPLLSGLLDMILGTNTGSPSNPVYAAPSVGGRPPLDSIFQ